MDCEVYRGGILTIETKERRVLAPAERLVVHFGHGSFYDPSGPVHRTGVRREVILLAKKLKGTGVCLGVGPILRACGYDLIDEIHNQGVRVLADLKLHEIASMLQYGDGALLQEARPEMLTVSCFAGVAGMRALKEALPVTEVFGVTVLTSVERNAEMFETKKLYRSTLEDTVVTLAEMAQDAGLDGIVCAPQEALMVREELDSAMTINTPCIRSPWVRVKGDDQNLKRSMALAQAIKYGVDRVIVGRPILDSPDPRDAVMRTLDEIASVL